MRLKYLLIGIMIFTLGGCRSLTTTSIQEAKEMVGDGFPNEYYEGVAAGCDSGFNSVRYYRLNYYFSYRKDNVAYQHNNYYRSGWDIGNKQCIRDGLIWNRMEQAEIQQRAAEEYLRSK